MEFYNDTNLPSFAGRSCDILIGMQRELFSFSFCFHVLSVPFCDHFVFLHGPLYMLNTYHMIPTFMFVILSTSVDLSHWTVLSRMVLSVLGVVCL